MIGVIGDIHGCINTLLSLVGKIRTSYPAIQLYCVGDLVDRGNFSADVIDYVISEKIQFTPGNHDYMFLYYMRDPSSTIGRAWIYNGYESTMASYDGKRDKISEHLEYIINAPLFINVEDCFISHAGISAYYKNHLPDKKFDYNLIKDLIYKDVEEEQGILWTREELLNIGKLQVVGHTRRQEILHSKSNNVLYIDTSVYTGNKLSAVIVKDNKVIDIFSETTFREDLN
jgi:serine/threonine protein phosphatase 1